MTSQMLSPQALFHSVRKPLSLLALFVGCQLHADSSFWEHSPVDDEAAAFFDDSYVHDLYITFDSANWQSILATAHSTDATDPYFEADFSADGVTIANVGVRYKGNSSFSTSSIKNSLKIDFNEFDLTGTSPTFFGMKKLNLNNNANDPTQMREKLVMDFASNFVAGVGRTVYTNVYVNGSLIGLYTAVEQIDKTFVQSRFGSDEDGNLYKGSASDELDDPSADFGSDLTYLGTTQVAYEDFYQLKTNEKVNDYTNLIAFIDVLNNTPAASLPAAIEPLLDVQDTLAGLAINNLFANLDSYIGAAHNYYIYERDDTGQFTHIFWDLNESFGTFNRFTSRNQTMTTLSPFWEPEGTPTRPGQPVDEEVRPLMKNLWAVDEYSQDYLRDLAEMLRCGFDSTSASARITALANLIRSDLYADPNKQYSNANFETNLTTNLTSGNRTFLGLSSFVGSRASYLNSALQAYAATSDLRLNEVMVSNITTQQDEAGDFEPWTEIYNLGPGLVTLSGLYLTDSTSNLTQWSIPVTTLDDGEFLTIWLDGETGEGSFHANFTPSSTGGALYLTDGSTVIDTLVYGALANGRSLARLPDGEGEFSLTDQPSFGSANLENSLPPAPTGLFINEFMADNDTTIEDPDQAGAFEDWVELYNASAETIDLGGMYLTDDLSDLTQWQFADGMTIAPGEFLLIWTDDDPTQGDAHATFKLSGNGETIALIYADGTTVLDSIEFGPQTTDVSYGRTPDGSAALAAMTTPTPGVSNQADAEPAWNIVGLHTGGSFTASFDSSASYAYTLRRSTNLSEGSWVDLAGQIAIPGTGASQTLTDSAPPTGKAFYQVVAELP